jgi:tetratricopeptide (TPR) repeat protein
MFSRDETRTRPPRHPLRTTLLGGVLAVLVAVAGYLVGRQLWAGYHLRAARQCLGRRDFPAASAHLTACLAVWPDDGSTQLLAARCARRAGRYDEAEEHLHRCRALEGPTQDVTLEGTLLRVQRGDLGEAESYLRRTITPDHPDAPLVLEALALGYVKTDRLASLLECTDLWLQVEPESSQALRWRGYAWERFRKFAEARDCYQRAVAADPLDDDARLGLGNLLVGRLGRPQEALDQFEQLRPRRPEDPAVLLGLARCYRQLGRPDDAEQILADLLARQPRTAEALGERGKLALDAGRTAEAEEWLRQAVDLADDDREALYNLIQCVQGQGKDDEARALNVRLKQLEADLARLDVLIPAIGRTPGDPDPRCEAGVICLHYGKTQEGLHWLQSALEVAPGHRPTHAVLADYYEQRGEHLLADAQRRLAGR